MQKSRRKLEWFLSPDKILSVVRKHLFKKSLYLQSLENPPTIRIVEYTEGSGIYLIRSEIILEINKEYICYRVLGRYVELHIQIIKKGSEPGSYYVKIKALGVSLVEREDIRIPVENHQVYLTNFLTSKHLIDPKVKIVPTTIKIGFAEFEKKLKQYYDNVSIREFEKYNALFDSIKKTGKMIFIRDTYDMNSFDVEHPECLNIKKILKDDLVKKIQEYRNKQVKSELIAPLYYLTHDHNYIPIGFIQIQNKSKPLEWEDLEKIKKWNQELIERMQQLNTKIISDRETVLNISKKGFRARIRHLTLINFLVKQSGLSCDIVFKGYPPISVYAEIRSSLRHDSGILDIGTQIVEFKNSQDEERFMQLVSVLEKKYKILKMQK